ncbi:hypothetical protein OG500_27040 [Kitasatospora sp. NBC_01250]|uniref:hypothetical protein n=1 Tax=unclassified Kitasatospora TaxID=2633591 RepID=UPI002E0E20A5|nr:MULTISPECIES: hypothetical protein [unclassified Kitasatospora]WSJ69775.1 hypothetical protein OG294_28800 [Kitasatospora sp. NBC_01302]
MRTLQRIADRMANAVAPKVTAEATWWVKDSRCITDSTCGAYSPGRASVYKCWDSAFCAGWETMPYCCPNNS